MSRRQRERKGGSVGRTGSGECASEVEEGTMAIVGRGVAWNVEIGMDGKPPGLQIMQDNKR